MESNNVEYIRKRDGRIVPFSEEKIAEVVFRAAKAVGGTDNKLAKSLAKQVTILINKTYKLIVK